MHTGIPCFILSLLQANVKTLTCISHISTQFIQRYTSGCYLFAVCLCSFLPHYLQICWCCHCCITQAHTMSKGLCGVNMLEAIMPDHLIMTRPSGSRARLPLFLLSIHADHTVLPQCPSTLQIHISEAVQMATKTDLINCCFTNFRPRHR